MDATDRPEFATLILTEVEACEVLRLHPHPNIAPYLGCVVENSHIKGPCFPKYSTILAHMLKDKVEFDRAFVQRDIEAGVEHMHKLGLLHGDLNPTNIMFDGNSAVIIDFDSCKKQSKKLGAKGGTPGWDLADAEYARRENDLYSLSLIATALENRYECIA
jgi:serine/threonine protein kinase